MLGLFEKKKEEPKAETPPPTNQPLEIGKEVTFRDPKTGEFIYQRALTQDQRKTIIEPIQRNSMSANKAIQLFIALTGWLENAAAVKAEIVKTEKEIVDAKQKIRDELKLDRQWDINPQTMNFEKRVPPSG